MAPAESELDQETSPLVNEVPAVVHMVAEHGFTTPQRPVRSITETPVTVEVGAEVPDESVEHAPVLEDVASPAILEGAADEKTFEQQHTEPTVIQDEQPSSTSEEPAVNEEAVVDPVIPTIHQDDIPPATDDALVSEANDVEEHPTTAQNEDVTVSVPVEDLDSIGAETTDKEPIEPAPFQDEPVVEATQEAAVIVEDAEDASLAAEETPVKEIDDTVDQVELQPQDPDPVVEETAKALWAIHGDASLIFLVQDFSVALW